MGSSSNNQTQPKEKSGWQKIFDAIAEGGRMARDARIGAIGVEPIRQLHREGKHEEAQELAKQYAKANIAGMTMAAGAANTAGLVGDLAITGVSTLADTAAEGNTDNFKKNLAINAMFDIAGKGVADVLGYVGKKAAPHVLRLLPEQMVSSLNKGVKKINYHKLTDQEWDDLYFKALNSGNMDEVQRLRDLHFKVKAPNTKAVDAEGNLIATYRGQYPEHVYTRIGLSPYSDTRTARRSSGYFSSNSPVVAKTYARPNGGEEGKVYRMYTNLENPKIIDAEGKYWSGVGTRIGPNGEKYGVSTDEIFRNSIKDGHDGVIIRNVKDAGGGDLSEAEKIADDYIAIAGRSKSADPITYDDAGNIIPLSKRDNFLKSDIRYALFPAAAVGAGFAAQSTEKKQQGGQIKPNFIKRLEDPNRKSILDWASRPMYRNRYTYDISTHKMGYEYAPDDTGRTIAYPEVQEVNGKLVDFTRPPYHPWAGYVSALDRGDYLMMKDLEEARKWVEGYKDRYKNLK